MGTWRNQSIRIPRPCSAGPVLESSHEIPEIPTMRCRETTIKPSQNTNRKDRLVKLNTANSQNFIKPIIHRLNRSINSFFEFEGHSLPCLNSSGMAFMGGSWPWELETCRFQNLGISSEVLSHEKQ